MDDHVKRTIYAELKTRVEVLMDNFIQSGKLKDRYGSGSEIAVTEWIAKSFAEQRTNIHSSIEKLTTIHVDNLKKQYDMLFATQLINKVKQAGFLKDEAAKLLLTEDKPS